MAGNQITIEVNARDGRDTVDAWQRTVDDGAVDAVNQIAVLAENAMKKEAPEGVGQPGPHMRTTIKARQKTQPDAVSGGDGYRKVVQPHKRTDEGWLLHRAIVGNPSVPSYDNKRPPAAPLLEWAEAKLGDRSAGWAIRESIYQDGHESLPNRFIDRSVKQWEDRAEDIAQDAVDEAFRGGA